jgi:hypothetical protein
LIPAVAFVTPRYARISTHFAASGIALEKKKAVRDQGQPMQVMQTLNERG